jgi:nickel superoxide dismutase
MLVVVIFSASGVFAHCEIPCGIYGDEMRFEMMREHIETIEKSMNMIVSLSAAGEVNYNQIVRWVTNKESHANELQHIITQYFLTQRVKPVGGDSGEAYRAYVHKLNLLHEMLVFSMKAKQSADLDNVRRLESLLAQFREAYFGE